MNDPGEKTNSVIDINLKDSGLNLYSGYYIQRSPVTDTGRSDYSDHFLIIP